MYLPSSNCDGASNKSEGLCGKISDNRPGSCACQHVTSSPLAYSSLQREVCGSWMCTWRKCLRNGEGGNETLACESWQGRGGGREAAGSAEAAATRVRGGIHPYHTTQSAVTTAAATSLCWG